MGAVSKRSQIQGGLGSGDTAMVLLKELPGLRDHLAVPSGGPIIYLLLEASCCCQDPFSSEICTDIFSLRFEKHLIGTAWNMGRFPNHQEAESSWLF